MWTTDVSVVKLRLKQGVCVCVCVIFKNKFELFGYIYLKYH